MHRARALSCCLILAWTGAGSAHAQGYSFLAKCADTFLGLELAIDYCTRAIKSGELSAESLAVAHYNRGAYWSRRRGYDLAIADFDEVLRNAPQKASALVARGAR